MKDKIKSRFYLVFLLVVFLSTNCSQEFIEPYREDPNKLSGEAFWENPDLARGVLHNCYILIMSRSLFGRMYPQPLALMAHESDDMYLRNSFWNEFNLNNVTPNNERIKIHYENFYAIVRDANDFIENYPDIMETAEFSQSMIDDWLGQAYFMRAYAYFNLVSLFGEDNPAYNPDALAVPLILKVPKSETELYPSRNTVGEIYKQIENDYLDALELIPVDIRGEAELGMIGKMAVHGYLGKAYLWQQKYDMAAEQFESIINFEQFSLVDPMRHVYDGEHEFGPESIWELNYNEKSVGIADSYHRGTFHQLTLIFSPRFGWPNLIVSDHAIRRFSNDPRRQESIAMEGDIIGGKVMTFRDRPFTRKFITTSGISGAREPGWTSNVVLLRLSDIFLLYAECQNALGNDEVALSYVNKVRKRAYHIDYTLPDVQVADSIVYNALTGTSLRDTIREERWRELFHENHRWFDLQRWKILEEEIAKVPQKNAGTPVYDPRDYYWPIPLNELKANPNLKPSSGY